MNVKTLLLQATHRLQHAGCDSPRLDAELLLMHCWGVSRIALMMRAEETASHALQTAYETLLQRRLKRQPVAQIIGSKEFWSRPFRITPDVLIPRPETEHLIEAALKYFPDRQHPWRICDIGTGSGCIAITLACEYPNASITATDISAAALRVAADNAETLAVKQRITFKQGNMLQPLRQSPQPFDLIISNPPYVTASEMETLEAELHYEPETALTDGANGLTLLTTILEDAPALLATDGRVIVETGSCGLPDHSTTMMQLEEKIFDLAGHLRGGIYQCAETASATTLSE